MCFLAAVYYSGCIDPDHIGKLFPELKDRVLELCEKTKFALQYPGPGREPCSEIFTEPPLGAPRNIFKTMPRPCPDCLDMMHTSLFVKYISPKAIGEALYPRKAVEWAWKWQKIEEEKERKRKEREAKLGSNRNKTTAVVPYVGREPERPPPQYWR